MQTNLTRKQKGFVKEYVETGNATEAALNNYDVKDREVAGSIGSENLQKPLIKHAIQESLPDDLLAKNHLKLFDQKQIAYFTFSKSMSDEEIIEHVKVASGIDIIVVRESDKGKLAFYSLPDANAIKGAVDMAYKIKGTYAPERKVTVNIDLEASTEDLLLAEQLKQLERNHSTETQ